MVGVSLCVVSFVVGRGVSCRRCCVSVIMGLGLFLSLAGAIVEIVCVRELK